MNICVHFTGWDSNGKRVMVCTYMNAEPEESLASIVDRVETELLDIKVRLIEILN